MFDMTISDHLLLFYTSWFWRPFIKSQFWPLQSAPKLAESSRWSSLDKSVSFLSENQANFYPFFSFITHTYSLSLSLSLSSSFLFLYHLVSFSFSCSKRLYMLYLQSYPKTTQLICCTILFLSFNDKFIIINHMYRSDKEYWKPCTWIPSPELTLQFLSFALSAFWLAGPNKKKSE